MLDMKKLYYLDALYRTRSFTKASEELFVSQPAITAAIKSMEAEVGVELVKRSSRGVSFTIAGEQFMLYVNRIINEAKDAEAMLREHATIAGQNINFGVSTMLAYKLLGFIYEEFLPKWPDASITVDEDVMYNHIDKIRKGELDLMYNAIPDNSEGLETDIVTQAEIFMMLRSDDELAKKEEIDFSDLEGRHIALPGENSRIRELVMRGCAEQDVVPSVVSQHNQVFCVLQMVRYSDCVGFTIEMPGYLSPSLNQEFALRSIGKNGLKIDVGFIMKSKKALPRLAKELIKAAHRESEKWLIS